MIKISLSAQKMKKKKKIGRFGISHAFIYGHAIVQDHFVSSLTYSTKLRCVRFVFPNALSFQVLIDFVNMHIRPCKNYTREYFMRKSNRMLAKMFSVLMQNQTRSRIYQIEFYSVKMIDQAFGLVCMGAHVCVCISSYMSCG